MCVDEDVTRPYTSSMNMRYDVEVSTCSETEEIESILLAVDYFPIMMQEVSFTTDEESFTTNEESFSTMPRDVEW